MPLWETFGVLFEQFGWAGMALLGCGGVELAREFRFKTARTLPRINILIGSFFFFVSILITRNNDPLRLFSPLLWFWVVIQIFGLRFWRKKGMGFVIVILASLGIEQGVSAYKEIVQNRPQALRETESIRGIERWAQGQPVYFFRSGFGTFYSKEREAHPYDSKYYNLGSGAYAFEFLTNTRPIPLEGPITFEGLESRLPPGAILIVQPHENSEQLVQPLMALRWKKNLASPPHCHLKEVSSCFEVFYP